MKKRPIVTCVVVMLAGCVAAPTASTRTESATFKSPTAQGREFRRVVAWSKAGLVIRKQTEGWAVAALRDKRVDAVASLDVWPIDASKDEIEAKLKASDIRAVLVLSLDAASSVTAGTVSTTTLYGSSAFTVSSTISKDQALFSATLFNVNTGRVVWQSQAFTAGNAYATWDDINASFVQKTVGDLLAAKVLYLCLNYAPLPTTPPADPGPPPSPDDSVALKKRYAARLTAYNNYVNKVPEPLPPLPPEDCPPQ